MPAILMIGFELPFERVMTVAVLGGLLGILLMIPLRRAFIVRMHGKPGEPGTLLYPEGTACAQVLESGETGGTSGKTIFIGFGLAFLHKFVTEGMALLKDVVAYPLSKFGFSRIAQAETNTGSELIGVGYIIGLRTSAVMMAGAVLGYLVLAPTITYIGDAIPKGIKVAPADKGLNGMDAKGLRANYLLFIGAGCVAAAGIISMLRTLPMVIRSLLAGLGNLQLNSSQSTSRRTEQDMPMAAVLVGSLGMLLVLSLLLMTEVAWYAALLGALLVLVFGFLFVTVSSRLTGEIGSSSNPISGMTVATLLMTCLIFLALGMNSPMDQVLALSIGGVVCVAASNGGTTSQDLKTGFLVGATPRNQQWAILIGALISALLIGGTLLLFSHAGTIYADLAKTRPLEVDDKVVELLPTAPSTLELASLVDVKEKGYKLWSGLAGNVPQFQVDGAKRIRVLQPAALDKLTETYKHQEKDYLVWNGAGCVEPSKTRSYLVTSDGVIKYVLQSNQEFLSSVSEEVLKQEDAKTLKTVTIGEQSWKEWEGYLLDEDRVVHRLQKSKLASLTEQELHEGKTYHVWRTAFPDFQKARKYLVDGEGTIRFLVDPTITGELEHRDDGSKVTFKFEAPKTQVMANIIKGVLGKKLNWTLILIGAMIAITLELCGVSSLAFAVGVYLPMQYSAPIFLGGVTRWVVDNWLTKPATQASGAAGEVQAITETETSPAVLMASGYIAGGSLAGVLLAFLEFSREVRDSLKFEHVIKGTMLEDDWLSLFVLLGMIGMLAAVGAGWILKSPTTDRVSDHAAGG
jgi:uncharacterized oligopeptide transporter (OPT) family protein